jgi:hypothetical protein
MHDTHDMGTHRSSASRRTDRPTDATMMVWTMPLARNLLRTLEPGWKPDLTP